MAMGRVRPIVPDVHSDAVNGASLDLDACGRMLLRFLSTWFLWTVFRNTGSSLLIFGHFVFTKVVTVLFNQQTSFTHKHVDETLKGVETFEVQGGLPKKAASRRSQQTSDA